MGADHRLFQPQAVRFDNLITPDWIDPEKGETLPAYARRMARHVDPGCRCFVGGVSFGGMVAVEMARHLDAAGCFLVASIRSPDELPRRFRALRSVARCIPLLLLSWLTIRSAGGLLRIGGPLMNSTARNLVRQFAQTDARFLRWSALAVLRWKPTAGEPPCPVLQIHGSRDRVLPHRHTRPDVLISGGGHLLNITHSAEVNDFLSVNMKRLDE